MADDTTRWDRVNERPVDKPAFSARQSTDSFRESNQSGSSSSRRSSRRHHGHHHSRARSAKTWYTIGVVVLSLLAIVLAWQLFAT